MVERRIGQAIGGDPGQAAEEEAKDHHGEEGLDDGPGRAEHRLLVAHRDVAPGEEEQQVTVLY